MQKLFLTALFMCLPMFSGANEAIPVDLKVGETMYNQLCVNCHASGIDNAPRLGVKEDWESLLPMGLETLYAAVIEGPNHMYSKGNSPVESEGEIKSMVAYMMDSVTDEDTKSLVDSASAAEKERHLRLVNGYKNYDTVCFNCHTSGEGGTPRIGHPEEWQGRLELGLEKLTESVINGKGHMYTRALTANLSAAEYRNMVEYMLSTLETADTESATATN